MGEPLESRIRSLEALLEKREAELASVNQYVAKLEERVCTLEGSKTSRGKSKAGGPNTDHETCSEPGSGKIDMTPRSMNSLKVDAAERQNLLQRRAQADGDRGAGRVGRGSLGGITNDRRNLWQSASGDQLPKRTDARSGWQGKEPLNLHQSGRSGGLRLQGMSESSQKSLANNRQLSRESLAHEPKGSVTRTRTASPPGRRPHSASAGTSGWR